MSCRLTNRVVRSYRSARVLAVVLLALVSPSCASPDSAESRNGAESQLPVVRAVALVPSLGEIVVALGGADALAGRTDYDIDPALVALPSVGGGLDPSLETMVELGVNLVLMSEGRDSPAMAERFESLGMEVLTFSTQSIDDIHTSIGRIGEALGREVAADSLSSSIARDLADVQARVADQEAVPVMFVVWSDPPMTTGGGTFVDEVMTVAGGRNVFADAIMEWPTVGFEAIVERKPDVVIWPQGEITIENVERLQTTAGWREVAAVQAGRVVLVDANLFNRPGPNVAVAARQLARALHPDLF